MDPSIRAPKIERLARIVGDPASLSEDYVRTIRALVALANCGVPGCRYTIVEDCWVRTNASLDDDQVRNAHRVLAALGNQASQRALATACWADAGEEELRRAA